MTALGVVVVEVLLQAPLQAVESEFDELLSSYEGETDERPRAAVVRKGHLSAHEMLAGVGPVSVKVPKMRSRTDEPVVFSSALVPPYAQRAKTMNAALPWLYLNGISTGQMAEALEVLMVLKAQAELAPGRLRR